MILNSISHIVSEFQKGWLIKKAKFGDAPRKSPTQHFPCASYTQYNLYVWPQISLRVYGTSPTTTRVISMKIVTIRDFDPCHTCSESIRYRGIKTKEIIVAYNIVRCSAALYVRAPIRTLYGLQHIF